MLTPDERARYARQLLLPELGVAGQEKLGRARVLVVGAGGLGSPAALYLAAAGVGTIGIVDDDVVDASNLHRQVLHGDADVGRKKAESAADALRRLNPTIDIRAHVTRFDAASAPALVADHDIVVDGSDNYPTRYILSDTCAARGTPWVYGSVERYSGQVSLFGAPNGPCYRCLFPEPPAPGTSASCEEIGVLGAAPGVIGTLQATETLKWIAGIGEPLVGRLLQLDLARMTTRVIAFDRRKDCPACAGTPADSAHDGAALAPEADVTPQELAERLRAKTAPLLLDVREPWEWAIGRIAEPRLVAMNDLPAHLNELDPDREMIVYCHHGMRSAMAVEWLRAHGFRARNLAGGIDRWSRDVDASVPRY